MGRAIHTVDISAWISTSCQWRRYNEGDISCGNILSQRMYLCSWLYLIYRNLNLDGRYMFNSILHPATKIFLEYIGIFFQVQSNCSLVALNAVLIILWSSEKRGFNLVLKFVLWAFLWAMLKKKLMVLPMVGWVILLQLIVKHSPPQTFSQVNLIQAIPQIRWFLPRGL